MNRKTIQKISAALLAAALFFLIAGPASVNAEGAALPLDYREGGKPLKAEGWVFEGKNPVSYEDSTIKVTFEREEVTHLLYCGDAAGETVTDESWIVRIKIQDPSQLRTAISRDTYTGQARADAAAIANSKNAVVAMDGDFFKYENDTGYVVRQGELIRDCADRNLFDLLLIDSEGDFHAVYSATTERINAYVEENLTPLGRTVMQTFNFGPFLVEDGRVPLIAQTEVANHETYEWRYPCQRICILQTGPLEYGIVEIYGRGGETTGMTMTEFAEYVAEKFPDAILAYNLDGGNSTCLVAWKSAKAGKCEMICKKGGYREITDILYFASAED